MTKDPVTKRGPGRPRGSGNQETRERLITVARSHFAKSGFAGASLRAIGAEAGVDASLIRHHFGDKSGLLIATLELPVNPAEILQKVIAQGPEGMGERLVRTFLTSWDPHAEVFSAMIRTALTSGDPEDAPAHQVAQQVVIAALRQVLDGDDRNLRAEL
ncbi:MAG TPA: TetR/AcrR family transcriptional regulator, partial [Aeromicrobium sp.]|nr:TetR/AcrR family transcriptional regulator [Aeromicrobium sp.]